MFSDVLKAFDDNGTKKITGIASSTTRDLHGDVMDQSALLDMERDAADNLTIFLNHSYEVPEDVFGSVTKAQIRPRGVDQDGNPNYDLDFEIVVDEENPRALRAWTYMMKGRKLGLSIGALIPEGGAVRDKKTGALTIYHVKLLETSVVSIPANPRSWITSARKALMKAMVEKAAMEHQLGSPMLSLDGDMYHIRGSLNGLQLGAPEPVVVAAAEPVEEGVEPDVTDSRVRIIEIDTDDGKSSGDGDSSQEAGSSDPGAEEDEFSAGEPDITANLAVPSDLSLSMTKALELLQAATDRLEAVTKELEQEQALRKAAEAQRDQVIKDSGLLLQGTRDVVAKLASTPLGRKATVREAADDLSGLDEIYDRGFLKLLTQGR